MLKKHVSVVGWEDEKQKLSELMLSPPSSFVQLGEKRGHYVINSSSCQQTLFMGKTR